MTEHHIPRGTFIYRRKSPGTLLAKDFVWEPFITTKPVTYDANFRGAQDFLSGTRPDAHLRVPAIRYYVYDLPSEASPYVQIAVDALVVLHT